MNRQQSTALTPWLLAGPALLLFLGVVLVPLIMTGMLSFHDFSTSKGIQPVFLPKKLATKGDAGCS